ncbi:MAG TPA: hypothetical protein VGJ90_09765 [Methylophilaceae bacterium]|jgi:hypothetical protein
MIHVVEIQKNNHARVWFAFDEEDFVRKVQVTYGKEGDVVIYQRTTVQQLQSSGGVSVDVTHELSAKYGEETPLYRADFMWGDGVYQTEPVSALRASLAAVASNADFRIYINDEEALEELDREPLFRTKLGFEARLKLRSQLVEMEVIAEDF